MPRLEFDPVAVGNCEYGWWRAHHEGNEDLTLELLLEQHLLLYPLSRKDAALALQTLAKSTQYHDAHNWPKAKEAVSDYYRIIKEKTGLSFDPERAAELEVGWWQIHDELEGTPDKSKLAEAFTLLYAEIFSLDPQKLKKAGEIKALATYEHDLAENPETLMEEVEMHWQKAREFLIEFYCELQEAVSSK